MNVLYRFPAINDGKETVGEPRKKRGGMFILIVLCVLIVASLSFGWSDDGDSNPDPKMSVHDVRSMIIETATHRPANSTHPNGGLIGSWWIYATESSGDSLLGLCLESKESHIGASRADIRIDSERNTLSFILENAVVAILPDGDTEGILERHDLLEIGPISLIVDVLDDEHAEPKPDLPDTGGRIAVVN